MALKMALRWKNPDSSADINLRSKGVFAKGFVTGGSIVPSLTSLQVDVEPFVLMTFDGAVVTSNANETLAVSDGQINYVVCRARYRDGDSEIKSVEVLTEAAYLADTEINWLHVVGVVDLSSGGPYAFPPLARVFYENRDTVDQQTRSTWREPVDTFTSLPSGDANFNRDGDVRVTLDTGSIYYWNATTSLWDTFAADVLITHRDVEHTNGITGQSAATTLQPDVNGTSMRLGAVPPGSGYTANGQYLTSPTVITDIPAAGVGAIRGLVQVAMDESGVPVSNYRVQKSADVLDITYARIIGISDDHPLGTFTLAFNTVGGTLSWGGGAPVTASAGTAIRLFDPTGVNWVDLDLVGAAPGALVSDNYDINTNLKNDDHLLVGYWYWDGAATLILGTDKRIFGNLGFPEMGDDFKEQELHPRWEDLRGNMIYSGGDITDLGGLTARVEGPIIAYIEGKRFEVAGAYNGLPMTDNAANYIYVDESGTLTVSTTNPTTGTAPFANIGVISYIFGALAGQADYRDPQLILGNATRQGIVQFAADAFLRWEPSSSFPFGEVHFDYVKAGSPNKPNVTVGGLTANRDISSGGTVYADIIDIVTDAYIGDNLIVTAGEIRAVADNIVAQAGEVQAGTNVRAQNVIAEDGLYSDSLAGGNPTRFEHADLAADTNNTPQQSIYLHRGSDTDLRPYMQGSSSVSIIGAFRAAETARKYGYGVISGLTLTKNSDSEVQLEPGEFIDAHGRHIVLESAEVFSGITDFSHQVYWSADTNQFRRQSDNNDIDRNDTLLHWFDRVGGVISTANFKDLRWAANGNKNRLAPQCGGVSFGSMSAANFSSLEAAMLHAAMHSNSGNNGPYEIEIADTFVELSMDGTSGINFADAWWTQNNPASNLSGLIIRGTDQAGSRPELTWSNQEPGIDFRSASWTPKNMTIENVSFRYNGTGNPSFNDITVFMNPQFGLHCNNVSFFGAGGGTPGNLTTIAFWDETDVDVGGHTGDSNDGSRSMRFTGCRGRRVTDNTGPLFRADPLTSSAQMRGNIIFDGCLFDGDFGTYQNFFLFSEEGVEFNVVCNNTEWRDCTSSIFNFSSLGEGNGPNILCYGCTIRPRVNSSISTNIATSLAHYSRIRWINCTFGVALDNDRTSQQETVTLGNGAFINCACANLETNDNGDPESGPIKVRGRQEATLINCDFFTDCEFDDEVSAAYNSKFNLPPDAIMELEDGFLDYPIMVGCYIFKSDAGGGNTKLLQLGTSQNGCFVAGCRFRLQGTIGAGDPALIFGSDSADTCWFVGNHFSSTVDGVGLWDANVDSAAGVIGFIGNEAELDGNGTATMFYNQSNGDSTSRFVLIGNDWRFTNSTGGAAFINFASTGTTVKAAQNVVAIGNRFEAEATEDIIIGNNVRSSIWAGNYFRNDALNFVLDPGTNTSLEAEGTFWIFAGNVCECAGSGSGQMLYTPTAYLLTSVGNIFRCDAIASNPTYHYIPTGYMGAFVGNIIDSNGVVPFGATLTGVTGHAGGSVFDIVGPTLAGTNQISD